MAVAAAAIWPCGGGGILKGGVLGLGLECRSGEFAVCSQGKRESGGLEPRDLTSRRVFEAGRALGDVEERGICRDELPVLITWNALLEGGMVLRSESRGKQILQVAGGINRKVFLR